MSAFLLPPYEPGTPRSHAVAELLRPEETLAGALQAHQLDPAEPRWCFLAARALMQLGRLQEALEQVRQGLALDPGSAWGQLLLSATLSLGGQPEAGLEAAQEAVGLASGEAAAFRCRAWAFLLQDREESARVEARRAVSMAPEDPDGHVLLARIHLDWDELEPALEAARRAHEFGGEEPWSLATLGDVLEAMGERTEATELFLRAVRIAPGARYPQGRLVELMEWGPLAVAVGLGSVTRLFTFLGVLILVRALVEGGVLEGLACVGALVCGLMPAAFLVRQAGRLKMEEDHPGAWPVYRAARRALRGARPWHRRWLGWLDPRE